MNKYAKIVLWVGLFLIAMTVLTNWSVIDAAIFHGGQLNQKTENGPTIGNPPQWVNKLPNGKCPVGYLPQSNGRCELHSSLPL